jgi:hypothetical protein
MAIQAQARHDFIISRGTHTDAYGLWRVDYDAGDLLRPIPLHQKAKFD